MSRNKSVEIICMRQNQVECKLDWLERGHYGVYTVFRCQNKSDWNILYALGSKSQVRLDELDCNINLNQI